MRAAKNLIGPVAFAVLVLAAILIIGCGLALLDGGYP